MGQIVIQVSGSFSVKETVPFYAQKGGHAQAVADAIEWLAGHVLPKAIQQDHELQEQGFMPDVYYGFKEN